MLCGAVWLEGYERLLFSKHFLVRDNGFTCEVWFLLMSLKHQFFKGTQIRFQTNVVFVP